MSDTEIKIKFANSKAARHFVSWLCGSGEQSYWDWMSYREQEEVGDITVIEFNYHGEEDESKSKDDPARYKEFMCDNIIRTKIGRLDKD